MSARITAAAPGNAPTSGTATRSGPVTSRQRRAGLSAGLSLLVMAVLAGWANLAVLEALVVPDDATRTIQQLIEAGWRFPAAVAAMGVVVVLDVVVAWQLWIFFAPVDARMAALAGWLRAIYAVVFAVAIAELMPAVRAIGALDGTAGRTPDAAGAAAVMAHLDAFHTLWSRGLALFGLHLALLGLLAWRSRVPRWISVLLGVAGAGYLIDGLGALLSGNYALDLGRFTFVGEVVLLGWLIVTGLRREPRPTPAPQPTQPRQGRVDPPATATAADRRRGARPAP